METPQGFSWGGGEKWITHSVLPNPAAESFGPRRRRVLALGLVLFVSFGIAILGSAYYLMNVAALQSSPQH
jgi:hypothetical protein